MRLLAQAEPTPARDQAKEELSKQAAYGYASPAQDAYQGAWSVQQSQSTASVWKALCDARPADVNAQFNWFRSERNARLSSNNGRLSEKDEAQLNSIADRINVLVERLRERRSMRFDELFDDDGSTSELVVTFLALLEMTRLRMTRLYQSGNYEHLHVTLVLTDVTDPGAAVRDDWR